MDDRMECEVAAASQISGEEMDELHRSRNRVDDIPLDTKVQETVSYRDSLLGGGYEAYNEMKIHCMEVMEEDIGLEEKQTGTNSLDGEFYVTLNVDEKKKIWHRNDFCLEVREFVPILKVTKSDLNKQIPTNRAKVANEEANFGP
ncbi:hypothetical protein REPUB_Repub17cG0089600 [Reevesia pubescens]